MSTYLSAAAGPAGPVAALLALARRVETPCGEGAMVWHVWGERDADPALRPLVLLHGGSGSWTHWICNIAALLASGRRLYVPDLPGFGDSALAPGNRDADALPLPLEQGLQQLLGDESCDLVGFSFGGMTGGFLAAQFPERIARLVLVGAPGLGLMPDLQIMQSWRHLPAGAAQEQAHRANLATLMLFDPAAIDGLALELHLANIVRDRMPGRRLARGDALLKLLPALRCPLHAICGREDVLYRERFDRLRTALASAADFRGLELVDEAGHWVQFEQAGRFNAALLAALDGAR